MSAETTASNQTGDSGAKNQSGKPRKARSKVERVVVWGLIGGLSILVLFEARARFGYSQSVPLITQALDASEKPGGPYFGLQDANRLIHYWPAKTEKLDGMYRVVTYKWDALFNHFSIMLTVEKSDNPNPMVLSQQTNTEVSQHSELIKPGKQPAAMEN